MLRIKTVNKRQNIWAPAIILDLSLLHDELVMRVAINITVGSVFRLLTVNSLIFQNGHQEVKHKTCLVITFRN